MKTKKPLKILFDANAIAISGKSGVGHYAYYLLQALADACPDEVEIVAHYYNFLGRKPIGSLPSAPNIRYSISKWWPGKATNALRRLGISIPYEWLIKSHGDVIVFPNFLTLPSLFRTTTVTTIHDVGFIEHPEFVNDRNLHDLKKYIPQSIKRSSLILANSEFTKESLKQAFGVPDNELLVTPVPPLAKTDIAPKSAKQLLAKLGISKSYMLFIGNLEPRKNLLTLLDAYLDLPAAVRSKYDLVIAGPVGWKNQDLRARIANLQAEGYGIITPGYITDDEKAVAFAHAALMVLPAFYEGFGMQILEAFQYGIPAAVSDIPVFHEVAGAAAAYFNPLDAHNLAETIARTLTDKVFQAAIMRDQQKELAKYAWSDIARELYETLRNQPWQK